MAEAMPTSLQTLVSVIVQLKQHVEVAGCACIVLGILVLDACLGIGVQFIFQSGALLLGYKTQKELHSRPSAAENIS